MTLDILLVDDEAPARSTLRSMLARHFPQHQVVGECADLPEAVLQIHEKKPHLVFLDVEMPRYSGLEIGRFFQGQDLPFRLVFLTGYSQYALQAFELAALDYLLKPLSPPQLQRAIHRAEEAVSRGQLGEDPLSIRTLSDNLGQVSPGKMALRLGNSILVIALEEMVVLEAEGSYTTIHTRDGQKHVLSKRLGEFESLLSHPSFVRPHRSFLVNMDHLRSFQSRQGHFLVMDNGMEVPVALDRKADIFSWIEQFTR